MQESLSVSMVTAMLQWSFYGLLLCLQVRETLQDKPGQVEDFVSLLHEFERASDGQEVTTLFRKLRLILGERTDLLRDFAAFLHPEQALQCGLVSRTAWGWGQVGRTRPFPCASLLLRVPAVRGAAGV